MCKKASIVCVKLKMTSHFDDFTAGNLYGLILGVYVYVWLIRSWHYLLLCACVCAVISFWFTSIVPAILW